MPASSSVVREDATGFVVSREVGDEIRVEKTGDAFLDERRVLYAQLTGCQPGTLLSLTRPVSRPPEVDASGFSLVFLRAHESRRPEGALFRE